MILRDFFNFELGISDANDMPFQNVHRLGARPDGKERSIIARFIRYNDYERVRKVASENSCTNQHLFVYQHYPRENYNMRKLLIPKIKELQRQKRKVKLIYEKNE